ncbi:hypothetical protein VDA_000129 [Photobacterium damselae subsp. damselae CIP 102761]|uniref:Uncharacterized protein n=1 Tax=Photobacterium damselae subsp. damselae CIP 102761 TaxID=675817 RepID=D0Z579_PHODD|nr:hypothetical protein VDA_000039 [Photobacterium damselae subsp. damselae CIP 102761]EEZ39113.1 hypothetical protein VDA_000129 [Photobacterium damselae subsp. damselae CIP 102761]
MDVFGNQSAVWANLVKHCFFFTLKRPNAGVYQKREEGKG